MKTILALDLGTHTGYAYNHGDQFFCGTWDLATSSEVTKWRRVRMDRRADPRILRLHDNVRRLLDTHPFDVVVFEDVQFSSSTQQTQLWSSFRAAVWLACNQPNGTVPECVPVGTLKKFAGHGGATKEMMASFLVQRDHRFKIGKEKRLGIYYFPPVGPAQLLDDNAVDAVWVWKWALVNLNKRV